MENKDYYTENISPKKKQTVKQDAQKEEPSQDDIGDFGTHEKPPGYSFMLRILLERES